MVTLQFVRKKLRTGSASIETMTKLQKDHGTNVHNIINCK
jgi:hypothetical protein